jgi:hypothetical protein
MRKSMMERWGECYFDHYERFLKNLTGRHIFEQDGGSPSIQVLAYDKVFSGCRVFASLGLTHYSQELGQIGEVVVVADDGWAELPFVLANALFYLIQHSISLGWGIAIGGIENISPGFVRSYQKHALYLTHPFGLPESFARVQCDGTQGYVYLGFFISKTEFDYFAMRGASQFEELLQSSRVDPYNLHRPSTV